MEVAELDDLVIAARAGAPEAIARLCAHFYPKVYRFMLNRTARREDAEDLAGDTCLRVLRSLPQQRGFFPAWVFRIAANLVTDTYRHGSEKREVKLPDNAADTLADPKEEGRGILPHQVARALETLTAEQRDVIHLRFVEGFDASEIAQVLGKSSGAVRALQFRAMESLREALAVQSGAGHEQ